MIKLIYKVCRKLYFMHLIPWKVWSPVYDHLHAMIDIEERY